MNILGVKMNVEFNEDKLLFFFFYKNMRERVWKAQIYQNQITS